MRWKFLGFTLYAISATIYIVTYGPLTTAQVLVVSAVSAAAWIGGLLVGYQWGKEEERQ